MPSMFGVCQDAPGARTRSVRALTVSGFRVHARQMREFAGVHGRQRGAMLAGRVDSDDNGSTVFATYSWTGWALTCMGR